MNKKTAFAALSLLALSLTACGAEAAATPQPAPTVTVTAAPEKVEVAVVTEVTPESCLTALDLAADGLAIAGDFIGKIQPAAQAGFDRDVAALEAITSGMQEKNAELDVLLPKAQAATQECRSLAK